MTKVNKNDVNQIFASNAPDQDKPPSFNNYTNGWGESRTNNGKPTIKQLNFIQQRTDQNFLWIHQNGGALPYDASIEYADSAIVLKDGKIQQLSGGVWSSYGSSDSDITTWSENSQADENKKFVTTVDSYSDLSSLKTFNGRTAYVRGDGSYYYSATQSKWVKDNTINLYDFKKEQNIQYYYDRIGNWDDAIYEAQVNVYLKKFSPTLVLPYGVIEIHKPILLNEALYFKINADYPELELYNESTGSFGGKGGKDNNYFTTAWRIIGQGKPAQIGEGFNSNTNKGIGGGTTISFVGGESIETNPDNLTYMNYGIIHAAPDFSGKQNAIPKDYWENKDDLSGFNRVEVKDLAILGNGRTIHGIVIWRSHWHLVSDLWIDDCYGAGLFMQWVYDLNIDRVVFTKCGRMSPKFSDYIKDGLFDIQYQTYAPLHITAQRPSTDNSNYVGVFRPHFENNYRCVADVIVNGNTSPIWFTNAHHETGGTIITGGGKQKVAYVAGKYGVQYFGKDSEYTFDYKSQEWNEAGAYITVRDCYGYTTNYSHAGIVSRYSELSFNNFDFSKDVEMSGQDANCNLKINDSILGNINIGGGFTNEFPLEIHNSTLNSVNINYLNNLRITNTIVSEGITLNNVNNTGLSKGSIIEDVKTKYIKGDLRGGKISDITFLDSTQQAIINSGGAISTIEHSDYFKNWLGE